MATFDLNIELAQRGVHDAAALRNQKGRFAAISRVWWSPISGLSAETSSSGPFWRASLRRQKSRSKLEEGRLIARVRGASSELRAGL